MGFDGNCVISIFLKISRSGGKTYQQCGKLWENVGKVIYI